MSIGHSILNDIQYNGPYIGNPVYEKLQSIRKGEDNEEPVTSQNSFLKCKPVDLNKPMEICLHSFRYEIDGKTFEAETPYWASDDFKFQIVTKDNSH